MSPITRTWLAIAAISAGIVHLALVVSTPLPIALVLLILGVAEMGWGLVTFARDEPAAPRIARTVALAPTVAWSLLVVTSILVDAPEATASLALLPMVVSTVFELFIAAVLSMYLRSDDPAALRSEDPATRTNARPRATPSAPRYLAGILAGAIVSGLLVTPALAASEAGRYGQPHGTHQVGFTPAPEPTDDQLAVLDLGDHDTH